MTGSLSNRPLAPCGPILFSAVLSMRCIGDGEVPVVYSSYSYSTCSLFSSAGRFAISDMTRTITIYSQQTYAYV